MFEFKTSANADLKLITLPVIILQSNYTKIEDRISIFPMPFSFDKKLEVSAD